MKVAVIERKYRDGESLGSYCLTMADLGTLGDEIRDVDVDGGDSWVVKVVEMTEDQLLCRSFRAIRPGVIGRSMIFGSRKMKTGIELIADERERQIAVEDWTPEHDDEHDKSELTLAAESYSEAARAVISALRWATKDGESFANRVYADDPLIRQSIIDGLPKIAADPLGYHYGREDGGMVKLPMDWPWADDWWNPSDDPVRNLVKAGALIAAEIDRIQRQGEIR